MSSKLGERMELALDRDATDSWTLSGLEQLLCPFLSLLVNFRVKDGKRELRRDAIHVGDVSPPRCLLEAAKTNS